MDHTGLHHGFRKGRGAHVVHDLCRGGAAPWVPVGRRGVQRVVGSTENESFGYSTHELEAGSVHLVGASVGDGLVGVGGIELQDGGFA